MNCTDLVHSTTAASVFQKPVTYAVYWAKESVDVLAAQRLRFEVFNLELGRGMVHSYATGLDDDKFDAQCEHLLVKHLQHERIVGTYRLQTGHRAAQTRGYSSAQQFDFAPYEPWRAQIVELGRASVHKDYRQACVLNLLWRSIASYARQHGARFLLGCSSFPTQNPAYGVSAYENLCAAGYLAPVSWRTVPNPECILPPSARSDEPCPPLPRILRAYLSLGAKVCGPPAIDREFQTIDFLTMLDLKTLSAAARRHFLVRATPQ